MRALLYRCHGPHAGPPIDGKGTTYDARGFDDADVAAAKADGWCESLPEAAERFVRGAPAPAPVAPPVAPPAALADAPEAATDKEALRAQARALGVVVDGRWSSERLLAEIAAAKGD